MLSDREAQLTLRNELYKGFTQKDEVAQLDALNNLRASRRRTPRVRFGTQL